MCRAKPGIRDLVIGKLNHSVLSLVKAGIGLNFPLEAPTETLLCGSEPGVFGCPPKDTLSRVYMVFFRLGGFWMAEQASQAAKVSH